MTINNNVRVRTPLLPRPPSLLPLNNAYTTSSLEEPSLSHQGMPAQHNHEHHHHLQQQRRLQEQQQQHDAAGYSTSGSGSGGGGGGGGGSGGDTLNDHATGTTGAAFGEQGPYFALDESAAAAAAVAVGAASPGAGGGGRGELPGYPAIGQWSQSNATYSGWGEAGGGGAATAGTSGAAYRCASPAFVNLSVRCIVALRSCVCACCCTEDEHLGPCEMIREVGAQSNRLGKLYQ